MKTKKLLLIIPFLLFLIGCKEASPIQNEKCYEDMPCWDCATMGNQICGTIEELKK